MPLGSSSFRRPASSRGWRGEVNDGHDDLPKDNIDSFVSTVSMMAMCVCW